MKILITLIFLITGLTSSFSQDESLGFKSHIKTTQSDSIQVLNFDTEQKGKIVIHQDKRVENITEFVGRQRESIEGTKIDGYRIQIFFAESRNTAQSQKANFLSIYSDHKAYIDYLAPNYRVRVGNFRTRLQAEYLKQQLISVYPTCIILEDKIELPLLIVRE
jgi:hypothetical protein